MAWLQGANPSLPGLVALRDLLASVQFFGRSVWAVPEGVVGTAAPTPASPQ